MPPNLAAKDPRLWISYWNGLRLTFLGERGTLGTRVRILPGLPRKVFESYF